MLKDFTEGILDFFLSLHKSEKNCQCQQSEDFFFRYFLSTSLKEDFHAMEANRPKCMKKQWFCHRHGRDLWIFFFYVALRLSQIHRVVCAESIQYFTHFFPPWLMCKWGVTTQCYFSIVQLKNSFAVLSTAIVLCHLLNYLLCWEQWTLCNSPLSKMEPLTVFDRACNEFPGRRGYISDRPH